MKQILLVHDEAADAEKVISAWFKKLVFHEACANILEDIFTAWVLTTKDFTEVSSDGTKDTWTTMASSNSSIESCSREQNPMAEKENTVSLHSRLHELADSLPYADCMIYLYVFLKSDDLKVDKSFIQLVGALKRLVVWHNAKLTVIKMDSELSSCAKELVAFVMCRCESLNHEPQIEWPSWNGKLSMTNFMTANSHSFPHFTLQSADWDSLMEQKALDTLVVKPMKEHRRVLDTAKLKQRITVCDRQIEALQFVDLRTFPVFMMTSWTLELQSDDVFSHKIMSNLREMETEGLLARICLLYDLDHIPKCGDTENFSTSAWKEHIISSQRIIPALSQDPQEEEVTPFVQYMYLLILPNFLPRTTSSNPPLLAKVLHSPTELSPAIFQSLDQRVGVGQGHMKDEKNDERDEINSLILSLPVVEIDRFRHSLEIFQEERVIALCDIDDDSDCSQDEFIQLLSVFEEQALDYMVRGCQSLGSYFKKMEEKETNSQKVMRWMSENSRRFGACPERLALQLPNDQLNVAKDGFETENFSSSTPLSARKQREKSKAKDFHIEDILDSFRKDGTLAKQRTKTPLKMKGNSICRITSQPDLSMKWPENQFFKYHDIYYYNSEEDLNCERKFVDLRDRGNFEDTHSSFLTPKKNPSRRPLPKLSPVRSSPRAKGAKATFSRSHSQSLSSMSPMKRFKSTGELFKQPSAQIIRKSPRKRLAPSAHPSNPDPSLLKRSHSHQIGSLGSLSDLSTPIRKIPHKQSNTTPGPPCNPMVKRLSLTPASEKAVRRSPRKTSAFHSSSFGTNNTSQQRSFERSSSQNGFESSVQDTPTSSQDVPTNDDKARKMKRSERHKMRLQNIITTVLKEKGVKKGDGIYSACYRNLFNVSLVLLKTLPNSQNLTEEMKSVVYTQVQQIINLEKRRSGIAV